MPPPKKVAPPSPPPPPKTPPPTPPKTTTSPGPTQPKVISTPKGPAANPAVVAAATKAAKPNIFTNPGANSVKGNIIKPPSQAGSFANAARATSVPAKNTGGIGRPQTSVPAKNTGGLVKPLTQGQQAAAARYTQQAKQIAIDKEAARDKNRASQWAASNAAKVTKPPKFVPNKPPKFGPNKNPGVLVIKNPDTGAGTGTTPPNFVPDPTPEPEVEVSGGFGAGAYSTPAPRQSLVPARDVVDFNTPPPSIEAMQQVLFEELSSFELVNMARRDTVEGLNPYYSVISNLSSIRTQYDPSKIISLQDSLQITDIYQISLDSKIPNAAYLARNNITNFFYIDTNGDFVLELDNLLPDEFVEIQIASSGKIT